MSRLSRACFSCNCACMSLFIWQCLPVPERVTCQDALSIVIIRAHSFGIGPQAACTTRGINMDKTALLHHGLENEQMKAEHKKPPMGLFTLSSPCYLRQAAHLVYGGAALP